MGLIIYKVATEEKEKGGGVERENVESGCELPKVEMNKISIL